MKKLYRKQTFEIFLTDEQKESFWNTAISCRRVHNHFLQVLKETGKKHNELNKELTQMKTMERYYYLKEADSFALQGEIFWLFNKFRRNPKTKPIICRMERWKYYTQMQNGARISGNFVHLPKLKWVELSGEPIFKGAAVKCSISGDWEQDRYWVELFWR